MSHALTCHMHATCMSHALTCHMHDATHISSHATRMQLTCHMQFTQLLKKELQKQDELGSELDANDLLFAIMSKKYSKERKKAKLLATILTFSNTSVNQRASSGMTALHHAVQVCTYTVVISHVHKAVLAL